MYAGEMVPDEMVPFVASATGPGDDGGAGGGPGLGRGR